LTGNNPQTAENGIARITFGANNISGTAKIITASPGLISDTLILKIENKLVIDDFEEYDSEFVLLQNWVPWAQHDVSPALDNTVFESGSNGMSVQYTIDESAAIQAMITRSIKEDWGGVNYLRFWFKGDESGRKLSIWLKDGKGMTWIYEIAMQSSEGIVYEIPLQDFKPAVGDAEMDKSNILDLKIVISRGTADYGSGKIYFDNFEQLISPATAIADKQMNGVPDKFELHQNYPNPFNPVTTINYSVGKNSRVSLMIYNSLGQNVKTLIDKNQPGGKYSIPFDASGMSSGIYYCRLQAGEFIQTRKMLLLR
jgi:hypothetical protein